MMTERDCTQLNTKDRARQKAWHEANRETVLVRQKAWHEANRGAVLARQKAWREANREKKLAWQKAYQEANKSKVRAQQKAWCEANPEKRRAKECAREAAKLKATPPWFCKRSTEAVYFAARVTGAHVDHIVPLRGKNVCGLHWHHNLQLLDPAENQRKNAKFDPDTYVHELPKGAA